MRTIPASPILNRRCSSSARTSLLSSEQIHRLEFPGDLKPGESVSFSYEQQFLDLAFTPMLQVAEVPKGFKTENGFGKAESVLVADGNSLVVNQSLSLLKAEALKEKFGELLDLIGRRSRLTLMTLVFKVKE